MRRKTKSYNKPLLLLALLVLLAVAIFLIQKHNSPKVSPVPTANIKQLPESTQPSNKANSGGPTDNSQGTSTDTHGQISANTQPGQWLRSASGNIIVKSPTSNSTISNGAALVGSATVDKVQYRLIDNDTGVISQGFLNVVNDDFSGTISFQSKGAVGRLDVFSTDSSGKEINEVQVPVKF